MYAKLFNRILKSSLMEEDVMTRYVFIMFLAASDPKGYVIGTDVALARMLNIPLREFTKSVDKLRKPDPNSNSHEEDGRRLVLSDGEKGYRIVNFLKYRNMRDEDSRREYMRKYMIEYRLDRRNAHRVEENTVNSENKRKQRKLLLAQAEEEAEEEVKADINIHSTKPLQCGTPSANVPTRKASRDQINAYCLHLQLPQSDADYLFDHWEGCGWRNGRNAIKDWKATIRAWKTAGHLPSQKNGNGQDHSYRRQRPDPGIHF